MCVCVCVRARVAPARDVVLFEALKPSNRCLLRTANGVRSPMRCFSVPVLLRFATTRPIFLGCAAPSKRQDYKVNKKANQEIKQKSRQKQARKTSGLQSKQKGNQRNQTQNRSKQTRKNTDK